MTRTRVLHLPGHTPYARKLRCERFRPVNGASDEIDVPLAAPVQWLLDQPTWRLFDVAPLHSVELVEHRQLEQLVERLRGARKRLIVTVHDVVPNIEQDQPEFLRKTRLVLSEADDASTLTPWAQQLLIARLGVHAGRVEVLPHGYVVSPERRDAEEPRLSRGPCLGVLGCCCGPSAAKTSDATHPR